MSVLTALPESKGINLSNIHEYNDARAKELNSLAGCCIAACKMHGVNPDEYWAFVESGCEHGDAIIKKWSEQKTMCKIGSANATLSREENPQHYDRTHGYNDARATELNSLADCCTMVLRPVKCMA